MARKMQNKKGIHGIGILLIFLAIIIISVSASALVINQAHKLAQDGGKSYAEVKDMAKFFHIVEVAATDGRDQELTLLTVDAKLIGDSPPMDMRRMSISIGEKTIRTILKYRSFGAPVENSNEGYNTWAPEEFGELSYTQVTIDLSTNNIDEGGYTLPIDVDGDGLTTDTIEVCDDNGPCPAIYDGTHLMLDLSGESTNYYVELRNQNGALINISTGGKTLDVVQSPISGGWGYVSVSGAIIFPYDMDDGEVIIYTNGQVIDTDLDDDGLDDYLGLNATHFTIDLSSHSTLISYPLGVDLSGGSVTLNVNQLITNGERYGTIVMQGTTTGADVIDASVTVTLSPYHLGGGYYVSEHLIRAKDSRNGYMVPGDVVRFYIETYAPIQSDDIIDVKIMYHDLETIAKKIYVGNTFPNYEKVLLYPKP